MVVNDTPTLTTYVEIFNRILATWDDCDPWAQPRWASHVIFYCCIVMTIVYLYTVTVIVLVTKRQKRFRNPFHLCMIVLAVGDTVTVVTTSREGATQTCALGDSPARHLAWEAIGASTMDLIIAVNLVISVARLVGVTTLGGGNVQGKYNFPLLLLLLLAVLWSITIGILHHCGVVKRIWFDPIVGYRDEFFFPFTHFRTLLLFGELGLTFLTYTVAIVKLKRMKSQTNFKDMKREVRLLILAFLIFASELLYVYSANWVGFYYFGWGSGEFNANLNYIARPLAAGLTPVFYFIFSSDIRQGCFFCCERPREKAVPLTKVSSARSLNNSGLH